ncbi:hypothetical protein C6500_00015 [Candidatus Poribacteria bacterium]|nr:MAG: hypothetical protein C6500_00015 [Candidatus Poribacteria bacterium]
MAQSKFLAPDGQGHLVATILETAEQAWRACLKSACVNRIQPLRKVADTIETHLAGILNAAVTGLTNARVESLNATIQEIKRSAHGYRNKASFISAIYFHCGDLDLPF